MGTRGNFDIFFGKAVTALEDYSAAQEAGERFTVYQNRLRKVPATARSIARVFAYLGPIDEDESTSNGHADMEVQYFFDMEVEAKGTRSGDTVVAADESAGVRLRLLIQQVLEALFPAENRFLGMPEGEVGSTKFRIEPYLADEQGGEKVIAAARLTMTVGLAWTPTPAEGVDLDSISVTVGDWSALMEQEEED